jgi:hypothetical protein
VDNSAHRLVPGLIVHTGLGEREISEIWLALADEPAARAADRKQIAG